MGEDAVTKVGGNVATYFCTPDGRVVHAVAGNVGADALLREAQWALDLHERATAEAGDDAEKWQTLIAAAHGKRQGEQAAIFGLPMNGSENGTPNGGCDVFAIETVITDLPANLGWRPTNGEPTITDAIGTETLELREEAPANIATANGTIFLSGLAIVLDNANGGAIHDYLAEVGGRPLEEIYPTVWQSILGETLSDAPVTVADMGKQLEAARVNGIPSTTPYFGTLVIEPQSVQRRAVTVELIKAIELIETTRNEIVVELGCFEARD